jgi:S-adenosylmethionine synthetase
MQISSESVKVGHPDIVADMIAANIIATILDREHKRGMDINTMPHCGIEVFLGKGLCVVGGEVSTRAWIWTSAFGRRFFPSATTTRPSA